MEALECQYSVKTGFEQQQLEEYAEKVPTQPEQHLQHNMHEHQLQLQHLHQHPQHPHQQDLDEQHEEKKSSILTPSKVGHEFVKQYYRILYKAPEVLHRFYMNDSTCTRHDFNMVIGKREIQHIFQRENYRKCRTNIFNTDIHGTIANGVIILVTGEQANMGSPMRSFVQTFVLAAEGPRKYYVSNDIFRYANMYAKSMSMLVDVECQTSSMHIGDGDRESAESAIERVEGSGAGAQLSLSSKAPVYDFYKSANGVGCAIPMPRWASARPSRDSSVSGTFTHTYTQQDTFTIQTDGDSNVSENLPLSGYNSSHEQEQQPLHEYPFYRSIIAQALSPRMEFEEMTTLNDHYVNAIYYNEDVTRASVGVSSLRAPKRRVESSQQQQQQQQQLYGRSSNEEQVNAPLTANETQQESQPPTYAKLFMNALTRAGMKNNNNTMTSSTSSPMKGANVVPNIFNAPRSNNETSTSPTTMAVTTKTTASSQHQQAMHGVHHPDGNNYAPVHSQDYSSVQRNNYSSGMRRNERRRSSSAQKYNDNQQLFLGQIPHNATEEELIRIFSCFGNVLELRILPNLNGKIQPGAKHPLKYGFLTFEHVESVKACLESRPVYFPNNSPDGQKLNVRAKKPAVSRDDQAMPLNCQSHDSQSLTSEWPQSRRNTSISSSSTIGSSAGGGSGSGGLNTVFNRKDNRNGRAVSLDSGVATGSPSGGRKFAQVASGVVNGCGGRR